jgi:peptide deformylase
MLPILQSTEKVLRRVAKEVPVRSIKTAKIQKVIDEMKKALHTQHDGVAIAAPQIGYSLRIFVVAGKIFSNDFARDGAPNFEEKSESVPKDLVFINPEISRLSKDKEWVPEGCLSVRWLYGKALRSKKAKVTAYDENGKKFQRGASGLLAQIFQHETDHLNGILFSDHAKDLKEEPPEKNQHAEN